MLGWISIVAIWILTLTNYVNLPDTIPIYYDASGQVDDFDGKGCILILSTLATILFIGLTILNKFPHVFKYPTNIAIDNAGGQYSNVTKLIRYLKLFIVILFGFIVCYTIHNANGHAEAHGNGFLLWILGLLFMLLLFFIIKSVKST